MCLSKIAAPTNSLEKISRDPLKDLFELIDIEHSPLNNNCNYIEPDNVKLKKTLKSMGHP